MSRDRDLVPRTTDYASDVVTFFVGLPRNRDEVAVLARQLIRSGTSVAANYREAARARSDQEYVSKLGICLQEADETDLWLELLHRNCGIEDKKWKQLKEETRELMAILITLINRNT